MTRAGRSQTGRRRANVFASFAVSAFELAEVELDPVLFPSFVLFPKCLSNFVANFSLSFFISFISAVWTES